MNLTDFDSDLKQKELDKIEQKKQAIINEVKAKGLDEYATKRELEMRFAKPKKLDKFAAVETNNINKVEFYFSKEELERFKQHFNLLDYKGLNTNSNWLLFGLIKLIEEGKIQYSADSEEVWVV